MEIDQVTDGHLPLLPVLSNEGVQRFRRDADLTAKTVERQAAVLQPAAEGFGGDLQFPRDVIDAEQGRALGAGGINDDCSF